MGALVTADSRWRWVFYINLPVGAIALAGLLIYLLTGISVRSNVHTGWAAVRRRHSRCRAGRHRYPVSPAWAHLGWRGHVRLGLATSGRSAGHGRIPVHSAHHYRAHGG